MLQKLKKYFEDNSEEQILKDWEEAKSNDCISSLTADEFLLYSVVKSLKDKKPLSFQDYKKLNYVHLTNVYACKYTNQIVSYEETLEEYNKYLENF